MKEESDENKDLPRHIAFERIIKQSVGVNKWAQRIMYELQTENKYANEATPNELQLVLDDLVDAETSLIGAAKVIRAKIL